MSGYFKYDCLNCECQSYGISGYCQIDEDEKQGKIYAENFRKNQLTMYERIEEADCSEDVKDILHKFAELLHLET